MNFGRILLLACLGLGACVAVARHQVVSPAPSPPSASPPLILLYDSLPDRMALGKLEAIGAQPWMQVNQDAKSYSTGVIDVGAVMEDIGKRTNCQPPVWMMLDFEEPFFANLLKPVDSEDYKRTVATMTAAIRAAKARYPKSKWSFYGVPNLPYWVAGEGWASTAQSAPAARKALLERFAVACAPLIAESDWVTVSIYDYYDPAMLVPGSPNSIRGTPESLRADGIAWRTASVALAKQLGGGKPVIPTVFPYWAPGGVAPHCRLIPARRFIETQVEPALAAGADGFALWTGMTYRIDQVVNGGRDPGYVTKEKNFGISEWRGALSADYLGGVAPSNWDDPAVRRTLVTKTSTTIIESLTNIRNFKQTGKLP